MSFFDNIAAIMTFLFLLVLLSYYVLLFIKRKNHEYHRKFSSITVILPAHNEEEHIKESVDSVLAAEFDGKKEIIVINDGSADKTGKILSKYKSKIKVITNKKHSGKSYSINKALKIAKGELIAIVDADTYIHRDALLRAAYEVGRKNVVATCGVVKVRNRNKFIGMWLHIEWVYNSLIRSLFAKINANVVTPGALSVYRKKHLKEIGGFSTEGFSEDLDIAIRLIRRGYKITFLESIVSETNIPYTIKGFFRQRQRLARGMINILKRHLQLNNTIIDIYTLPLFLFTYVQAIIMGALTIYNLAVGYTTYFASKGVYLNLTVAKFFFEWFSIVGFIKWTYSVLAGTSPLTILSAIGIFSTLLSYPLFFYAIFKYDRKFDWRHALPIFFMFPYWLVIMTVYIIVSPEVFRKKQYNIWKK